MNQQLIADFMEQAKSRVPAGLDTVEWIAKYNQIFAELIVRECAQACINMGNDYEIKSAGQYQAELFAFAIKQHFGVEE